MKILNKFLILFCLLLISSSSVFSQGKNEALTSDQKSDEIIKKAIEKLGGEKYKSVKSQIGRGKFSIMRDGAIFSFQSFLDIIVYPDKERTEFTGGSGKTIQTNSGDKGWIYDGSASVIAEQNEKQIEDFKRGMRVSFDNLLRGHWSGKASKIEYVGKRQAGLGYRNDVIKLKFEDGFTIEFEFSPEGLPAKSIYKRLNEDNEEITEEDRYAQFVDVGGVKTPFIIDHFTNKKQTSRINYESVEFNKSIPEAIFAKPANPKDLKKNLKFNE